jgi:ubiquinone/menaquinone biosynthesis C-methylase UbiE
MRREELPAKARVSQRDASALYDKLAGLYDLWGHLTESKARNRSLDLADIKPGQHVLEVAVGTGLAFLHIVRANPDGRNVGVDISQGMLSKAEHRLQKAGLANYELSIGSALAIQEQDNAFDVLLNSYMLDLMNEHEWITVLTEFHRVLKPGGRLVLVNMTFGEKPGSGIYQRLYGLSPALMGGCRGIKMSDLLQRNGFTVHSREYIQQLLFPSEVILASKGNAQQGASADADKPRP